MKLNFCAIGVHQWSDTTYISGFHEDGIENLFFRPAIQTGEQSCTRDNCTAFRHVARRLRSESDTATGA